MGGPHRQDPPGACRGSHTLGVSWHLAQLVQRALTFTGLHT
uniref:Uncharacterized protein n=1 Tax=Arundo donax TaxID=35708 RepID=A0A0A8YXZ5_ARUDO